MSKIEIVIGNAYGDEGKGHVVDYLARPDSVVVRFSGGAQAGHTVVTPEGRRHVFHSFGSGTFRGAATYLSRFFGVDPVAFNKEAAELADCKNAVYVDPMAPVVTPFDVLMNQMQEKLRDSRHGSCGYGFGEAMRREEEGPVRLRVIDLLAPKSILIARVEAIRIGCSTCLCDLIRLSNRSWGEQCRLTDKLAIDLARCEELFFESIEPFLNRVVLSSLPEAPHYVFEGSQGLLLDRDIGVFPHVTRAKTGLINVHAILGDLELNNARIYWVSRAYLTRHGAGPLEGEQPCPEWLVDQTNIPNEWQGTLRYAPYNAKLLSWARLYALNEVRSHNYNFEQTTVTTCADQLSDGDFVPWSNLYSYGPTRNDFSTTRRKERQ